MTNEQKIIHYLASIGQLTNVGEVCAALEDPEYAKYLTSIDVPEDGELAECDHESLSNSEIQEVFDNDEE